MRNPILTVAVLIALAACGKSSGAPASATSLAAQDIASPSPIERPFRVKGAEKLDVERLFAYLPDYLRPRYTAAAFDEETGATIVTALQFGAAGYGFSAERAEFFDVDLASVERISNSDAAETDAPMLPVVGKLRLFGIASTSDGSSAPGFSVEAIEIDSLRVREGGLPKSPRGSGLALLFNSFELAGVYVKDARFRSGDNIEEQGPNVSWSAADMRLIGLGAGKMTALLARNVEFHASQTGTAFRSAGSTGKIFLNGPLRKILEADDQTTKIKTVEWRDADLSQWLQWGLKGERPPVSSRNLVDLGTARLTDFETYIGGRRASLVPETDISAMEFAWLSPSKVRIVSRDAVYDLSAYMPPGESDALSVIRKRNLDSIKIDSALAYDWNPDRGTAALSMSFDGARFAEFDFNLALEGLELEKIAAARAAGALQPVRELGRLKSMSISLADEGLLDAFFDLSALEAGGSAKDVRIAAPAMLRLTKRELARNNPRLAAHIDAFADFIEEGGTLEIAANPVEPLSLKSLEDSADNGIDGIANALNLTVTRGE